MASVCNRPNGHRNISFRGLTSKRHTVRLGKVTRKQAEDVKRRIEALLAATAMHQPPDLDTARWVGGISPRLHAQLARCGLVAGHRMGTVRELVGDFLDNLRGADSTQRHLAEVCDSIVTHFGEGAPIASITEADAEGFRSWLTTHGRRPDRDGNRGPLAAATVSRRTRRAKQVFEYAVKARCLLANPFDRIADWNEENPENDFYVSRELIESVLAEIPDPAFRAIVVLTRYGGLRCPSEVLPLEWADVNWEKQTFLVHAPKTARHKGKAVRTVPLFPEVEEALSALWQAAPEGERLVFPRHQMTNAGLTSKLESACRAAGVPLWPRPQDNMRATRITELLDEFPIKAVEKWVGTSAETILKHYAQVAKEHEVRAANVKMRKSARHPEAKAEK
jgi:integrase